jgi:hypothetical protein
MLFESEKETRATLSREVTDLTGPWLRTPIMFEKTNIQGAVHGLLCSTNTVKEPTM